MSTPTIPFGTAGFIGPFPFDYYPLLSDGDDIVSRSGSVALGGGVLQRGAILKYDPATGLVSAPVVETDCNCILAGDIDATSAAAACVIYVGGKFKADAVIWPGALNHALITESLRQHDMQIESVVFTDGSLVKSTPTEAEAQEAIRTVEENRGKEAKAAAAVETEKLPPSDSPWAYLTPEERANKPELAKVKVQDAKEGNLPND
jgi:hypothetical protein